MKILHKIKRRILFYLYKGKFHSLAKNSLIVDYKMLTPRYIDVGDACVIWYNCRIEGVKKYNSKYYNPLITLKNGVRIQQNCHITCANRITIGENTCISANVTITDIDHPYDKIDIPIERQDLEVLFVSIGSDCKIYNGAVVLPGVTIGKHCVIGANSVVSHDIPDYCVAVGVPAHIIKRFDFISNTWKKTDSKGNFLEK